MTKIFNTSQDLLAVKTNIKTVSPDIVDVEPKAGPSPAIVYCSIIPDTLYAAAQIVSALKDPNVVLIDYHRYDDPDVLKGHEKMIICGLDLTDDAFEAVKDTKEITYFIQRENYERFSERKFSGKVECITPMVAESYNSIIARYDNTVTGMSHAWLDSLGLHPNEVLKRSRILAARFFNHIFPVVNSLIKEGEFLNIDEEMLNKAMVYNLRPVLRDALSSKDFLKKLDAIKRDWSTDAYIANWRGTQNKIKRAANDLYIGRNRNLVTKTMFTDSDNLEVTVSVAGLYTEDIVIVERLKTVDISRVSATSSEDKMKIGNLLQGADYWWEGPFYCSAKSW